MAEDERSVRTRRRRGAPDPVALISGLLALVVAGYGLAGVDPGTGVDLRWALAVVAVLAGTSFIVMSLRGSGNSRATSDD